VKTLQLKFEVQMEGAPDVLTVLTDQRDHAAYEASDEYQEDGSRQATKLRYLCWNAMRRTKTLPPGAGWPRFNSELCIQVQLVGTLGQEGEPDGEEGEDPS